MELPEEIIQHIQSFMDIKQGTQSTLLSKSWLQTWSTRPFLDFDSNLPSRGTLVNLLDTTLQTYLHQGIPIRRFRLQTHTIEGRWLKSLLQQQNNLIELDLYSSNRVAACLSSIWRDIFMTKSLQVLKVGGRGFESDLVLTDKDIKCHNLKKLDLSWVHFDDLTFQHIIRYCPLIEEFLLSKCSLLSFRAADFPNLRLLRLVNMGNTVSVDVCNSPRLQSLDLQGKTVLNIDECGSLQRFGLIFSDINEERLQTILSKNPHLEDLTLFRCYKPAWQFNLSSLSLRCLEYMNYDWHQNLVQLIIDAPNLQRLKYVSYRTTPFPIISPTTKGEINVSFFYPDREIDASWFHRLREFLAKFSKSTVMFTSTDLRFDFTVLRTTPLWQKVEALTIQKTGLLCIVPLLYAFFNICYPKTVLLRCTEYISSLSSLKNLSRNLRHRRNLQCCKFDQNKCWRHYIKDAKFCYVVNKELKPFEIGMVMGSAEGMDISIAIEWECSD